MPRLLGTVFSSDRPHPRAKVKSDAWLAKKEAEAEEAEAARIKALKAQDSQPCTEHGKRLPWKNEMKAAIRQGVG